MKKRDMERRIWRDSGEDKGRWEGGREGREGGREGGEGTYTNREASERKRRGTRERIRRGCGRVKNRRRKREKEEEEMLEEQKEGRTHTSSVAVTEATTTKLGHLHDLG